MLNWLLSQILTSILFQFKFFALGRQDEISGPGNSYYSILDMNHQAWNMTLMLKDCLENRWKEMILHHQREMIRYTKFQFLVSYHVSLILIWFILIDRYYIYFYIFLCVHSLIYSRQLRTILFPSIFCMYMSPLLPHPVGFNNKGIK